MVGRLQGINSTVEGQGRGKLLRSQSREPEEKGGREAYTQSQVLSDLVFPEAPDPNSTLSYECIKE